MTIQNTSKQALSSGSPSHANQIDGRAFSMYQQLRLLTDENGTRLQQGRTACVMHGDTLWGGHFETEWTDIPKATATHSTWKVPDWALKTLGRKGSAKRYP